MKKMIFVFMISMFIFCTAIFQNAESEEVEGISLDPPGQVILNGNIMEGEPMVTITEGGDIVIMNTEDPDSHLLGNDKPSNCPVVNGEGRMGLFFELITVALPANWDMLTPEDAEKKCKDDPEYAKKLLKCEEKIDEDRKKCDDHLYSELTNCEVFEQCEFDGICKIESCNISYMNLWPGGGDPIEQSRRNDEGKLGPWIVFGQPGPHDAFIDCYIWGAVEFIGMCDEFDSSVPLP